ncbi:MAG: hypothetical protein KF802_00915 [Bdellovibrionaceae bacterium]|nr:hypothetical protein [Pseudobdellovibrionaceae bacterium]MBX3034279.1 hypothetical protein [Pseudobdellovibrionaceae bacterium]
MKLKYQLPPTYRSWFPAELWELDPVETKATCDDCAMAPGKHRRAESYRADLKCCTFHPWLPNFAVGALLEEDGEGARRLREKIRRRQYALPTGVLPPVRYQIEFNRRRPGDFGNREDWLCPYYEKSTRRCTVWRHRGSVCSSFYCFSDEGKKGLKFWRSLENFLGYLEMAMMEEALVRLDFSPRQVSDLLGLMNREDGTQREKRSWSLPEKEARRLWNGYYDEQEDFYRRCFRLVRDFSRREIEEALGEAGTRLRETALVDSRCFR